MIIIPATAVKKSPFEVLNAVNVEEHLERKGNLTYLSWAWAWQELKKRYPKSFYTVYEADNHCFYFTDGKTAWVKTGVTLVDGDEQLECIEYLPVMDMRNKSMSLDSITSFDVNKSIQRSLTKAIARHGLGLYIYAGEDVPEAEREQLAKLESELKAVREGIVTELKRITKYGQPDAMSIDEQKKFKEEHFNPILGEENYRTCTDAQKLDNLLKHLKQIQ